MRAAGTNTEDPRAVSKLYSAPCSARSGPDTCHVGLGFEKDVWITWYHS